MFSWDCYHGNLEWLQTNTIFLARHGSHAYGTNIATSDEDYKGIAIPPKDYFLGYLKKFEQAESKNPDLVIFDIRKFFHLAADCNPNIIEVLFTDPSDYVYINEFGEQLVEYRHLFLSQKIKHTFSGYALAQLKRIRTHKKWLLNPPDHKPTRKEYDLPEQSLLSNDILGAIKALEDDGKIPENDERFPAHVMTLYHTERAYQNSLREWQQFQNWQNTRNKNRAELEKAHGYDTKHAMHLVRLLRMCREILTTGVVTVKRPDAEELLAIRNGAWTYDQIIEFAEKEDKELTFLMSVSPLPKSPDRNALDSLCGEMVEKFLRLTEYP